jgi:hypothetical protein
MNRACRAIWESLIELAEGKSSPVAEAHVAHCANCSESLAELRQLFSAGRTEWHAAPMEVVDRAYSIMPQRERRRAVFVSQSFGTAFARSGEGDFQMTFSVDGSPMRLLVSREQTGWSLVGQVPTDGWSVGPGHSDVRQDMEGRFRIHVRRLEDSAFVLRGPFHDVEIPAITEFLDDRN